VANSPTDATDPSGLEIRIKEFPLIKGGPTWQALKEVNGGEDKQTVEEILTAMQESKAEKKTYAYANILDLEEDIKLRLAIIEEAHMMAEKEKKGLRFGGRSDRYIVQWLTKTPDNWMPAWAGGFVGMVTNGAPSKALQTIREIKDGKGNPELSCDCVTAAVLVAHLGLEKYLGAQAYDKLTEGHNDPGRLGIGSLAGQEPYFEPFSLTKFDRRDKATGLEKKRRSDLIPGDIRYYDSPNSKDPAYEHEATIYLGHKQYFAHPFGVISEHKLLDELNGLTEGKKGAHDSGKSFRLVREPDFSRKPEPIHD
jgi:hypothetical protein